MDPSQPVLGRIRACDIWGTEPDLCATQKMLERELEWLLREARRMPREQAARAVSRQRRSEEMVNARPGSMALPQSKIRLFMEYSGRYRRSLADP